MEPLINKQESKIVFLLSEIWNEFMLLETQNDMEQEEFCSGIHQLQNAVLARSAQRFLNKSLENKVC